MNDRPRIRIPPDLAPVLELYRDLGHAARKGLWLAEKQTRAEVEAATRAAEALRRRASRGESPADTRRL